MMSCISRVAFALTITSLALQAQSISPKLTAAEPATGKRSDLLAFSGENLGSTVLGKLFLTDGEHDYEAALVQQTLTRLTFRIPEQVPPGRFAFMALTAGKDGRFVELPRFRIVVDKPGTIQIEDREKEIRAACSAIYQSTANKKIADLTVIEEQQVRNCQSRGIYPPQ